MRSRLRPRAPAWRPVAAAPSTDWLTPILVDSFGRDGSTLMMALLATSPQIVVEETYPYERHYFTYLWRWARLLGREDWPAALWRKEDVVSLWQEDHSALLGPPPWLPRELFEAGPDRAAISRRAFELVWGELSSRAIERAAAAGGERPRYSAEKHGNTWLVDERELPPLETVVLLRDPRDIEVSMSAYEDKGALDQRRDQCPVGGRRSPRRGPRPAPGSAAVDSGPARRGHRAGRALRGAGG